MMASKCSPSRPDRSSAAADFRTRRSTFVASSSRSVQCFASAASSAPEADQIATPRYMIIQIVLASLCITVVFAGLALRLLLLHL